MNKLSIIISATLFVFSILFSGISSAKSSSSFTCKYQNSEIGKIKGFGKTKNAAFSQAADICFDRHVANFKSKRTDPLTEDRQLTYIDICANISCQ